MANAYRFCAYCNGTGKVAISGLYRQCRCVRGTKQQRAAVERVSRIGAAFPNRDAVARRIAELDNRKET